MIPILLAIEIVIMSSHFGKRQEQTYIALAGIFLGTLGIINILGLSRFVDLSFSFNQWTIPMVVPLGVLPYPITFFCIDLISEFYGKERASWVVWVGLLVNIWIFFILWLAGTLPPHIEGMPPTSHPDYPFFKMRLLTMSAIIGSMIAYLFAQFLDIRIFLFCKKLTKNKHLWLRNNLSTCISQFVDTIIVISIAYFFSDGFMQNHETDVLSGLCAIIMSAYLYKLIAAILCTFPFYLTVFFLKQYFGEMISYPKKHNPIQTGITR